MFTLVLLSVIGLGLMYSTNMESNINANYRDKQLATYGAMSGIQEARDRLQPSAPKVPVPTAMPTLTNHQVIYVINPSGGETVAPWSSTNRYMDTELCQEGILGLTATPGIPCTTLPTGTDWYTVVSNTDVAYAPWNLATPTDTKWIRITLKGNNMTPVPVNGVSGTSTQTCWDGAHQTLKPGGYGDDCSPDGSIAAVNVTAGGTGYTSAPTVTIAPAPAGGTTATGTATIGPLSTGQLSSIDVVTPGAGYSVAPVVVITGDGTGATATANIVPPGSPVTSVTLTSAGQQCYSAAPGVSFSGGGSGAAATTTLAGTNSCVASWNVSGSCSARKGTTFVGAGLSGGGGSGFSGSITFKSGSGAVTGVSIQNPGTGYTSNPTTLTGVTGCGSLTLSAVAGKVVQSMTLTAGGGGYVAVPTVGIASGAGTAVAGPTATATIGPAGLGGTVSSITLNTPGSGYTVPPLVTLTGGGPGVTSVATAVANLLFTNTVTGVTLTNPGLGYTSNPAVTFSGGGGAGAAATATTAQGSDYGRVYLVTVMSQTKSGARAMAQAELATPVLGLSFPGALTLAGPSPDIGTFPNSNPYYINGTDQNSCGETAHPTLPAIGGYDDPNADPPTTSVDDIIDALPRPDHYIGTGGTPSVVNVFSSLGEVMGTPTGLKALIDAVAAAPGAHVYGNNPGSIALGSAASPVVDYVDGNVTLNGNTSGYGVLVVNGTLTFGGNFVWNGIVLVVGNGHIDFNGGGNGQINGSVFVAKIWDDWTTKNLLTENGSPKFDWNGGGGNGIYYDHCLVENYLTMIPFTPPPSTKPLKILSSRTVTY
jgi:hypothetical protein